MDPQDIVRKRYPEAAAEPSEATQPTDQQAAYQPTEWKVFKDPSVTGPPPIATGATEDEAWRAAVAAINKEENLRINGPMLKRLEANGFEWNETRTELYYPKERSLWLRIVPTTGKIKYSHELSMRLKDFSDPQNGLPAK